MVALFFVIQTLVSSTGDFPVTPEVFIDEFDGSEGIAFNAEGRLFLGADGAVWIAEPDGKVRKIADVDAPLGLAGIGPRDILAADFGPANVFQDGPNDDGIVWRITPEGRKTVAASGIADPNFVLVLPDGTFLVSDDGTDKIYRVRGEEVSLWSAAVSYPNGMALSLDDRIVYVAQIFKSLDPLVGDDRLWAFDLVLGVAAGGLTLAAWTGEGGIDGLAGDELGRIYVADNGAGKIFRFDPRSNEVILIGRGCRESRAWYSAKAISTAKQCTRLRPRVARFGRSARVSGARNSTVDKRSAVEDGVRLDLDQHVGRYQSLDLHHGRCGRVCAKELAVRARVLFEAADVCHVHAGSHHVGKGRAEISKRPLHDLETTPRLPVAVAGPPSAASLRAEDRARTK